MRWKPNPEPRTNSWRVIKKFAWIPVLIDLPIKQYVWLEFYQINQRYDLDPWEYNWIDNCKAVKDYWSKQ